MAGIEFEFLWTK